MKNNVMTLRKLRGLSQTQLAELVGTSQPHISRIERGDDGITLGMFRDVATALGVSVADLFADDRAESERVVLEAFRQLSDERQQGWIDMAKAAIAEPRRQN